MNRKEVGFAMGIASRVGAGLLVAAVMAMACAGNARAESKYWVAGGDAEWDADGNNWAPVNNPGNTDLIFLTQGVMRVSGNNLTLSSGGGLIATNCTLIITNGATLTVSSNAAVFLGCKNSFGATVTLKVESGTLTNDQTSGMFIFADCANASYVNQGFATVKVTGTGTIRAWSGLYFGHAGPGGFDVELSDDATMRAALISVGVAAGATPGYPRTFRIKDRASLPSGKPLTLMSDVQGYQEGGMVLTYGFNMGALDTTSNCVWRQSGGTNEAVAFATCNLHAGLWGKTNIYMLSDGLFDFDNNVAYEISPANAKRGEALFYQSGGTARFDNLRINTSPGGTDTTTTGMYHIVGGVLDAVGSVGGIQICRRTTGSGIHGTGILRLGDASTSGVVTNCRNMSLITAGITSDVSRAYVTGWGSLNVTNLTVAGGRGRCSVVADGYGTERTLAFVGTMVVSNPVDNAGDTNNGWFAENKGRLELPPLTIRKTLGTTFSTNWGEAAADDTIDLANSARLTFNTLGSTGKVAIALLATNRTTEIPAGTTGAMIGVWEVKPDAALAASFNTFDLKVRYDPSNTNALGITNLKLYKCEGTTWTELSTTRDQNTRTLTVTGLGAPASPYLFAAGQGITAGAGVSSGPMFFTK